MKKRYIWLIEIIVWLLIISSGIALFIYNSAIKANAQNTYYLFFDDVDGLVRGSSVRLMGIDIGYIRQIKIIDNKVFVSFLVTKKDVAMPKCATATIQFYGLGGSTSLELTPAAIPEITEAEEIIPSKAYRVQDFWDGQALVANVMINIYGSIGRTIKATGLIDKKQYLKQSALLDKFTKQSEKINNTQTVYIYKMSEATLNYLPKLPDDTTEQKEDTENE